MNTRHLILPVFAFLLSACPSGPGWPPFPVSAVGQSGVASRVEIMNSESVPLPYRPNELACLVDATFRAYQHGMPNEPHADQLRLHLAHLALFVATEEQFQDRCGVPSTAGVSCLTVVAFPDNRQPWFWSVNVRSSHFVNYADSPGEPMVHELVHAISRTVYGDYDSAHTRPELWATHGAPNNVQGVGETYFREQCLPSRSVSP